MPTGYTYQVVEGKVTELKDFVLSCCRAFGACIDMRDDSSDAPIPEEFKPSDYHDKALTEALDLAARLQAMDLKESAAHGTSLKTAAIESIHRAILSNAEQDQRLNAMIAKVEAWTPPTSEHTGLKDFMLQQLRDSRNGGDYWARELQKTEWKPAIIFYMDAMSAAVKSIEYHTTEQEKDIARAQDRTNWMKAVRASLETKAA